MQNSQINQIKEDILIIGGGPSGSLLAHILSKYQNYSVRIIETLPDLRNPTESYVDRSSSITLGTRAIFILQKYGLFEQFQKISMPLNGIQVQAGPDIMHIPFSPVNPKFIMHSVQRRNLTNMLIENASKSEKVKYEFNTKVLSLDLQKREIVTQERNSKETQTRTFNLVFGADGYFSITRESMEKALKNEKLIDENTQFAEIINSPYNTKSIIIPTLKQLEEYKNSQEFIDNYKKYYDEIPQVFKDKIQEQKVGNYVMDPNYLTFSPQINGCMLQLSDVNEEINLYFALPESKQAVIKLKENLKYEEFKVDTENVNSFEDLNSDQKIHEFMLKNVPAVYARIPDFLKQFKQAKQYQSKTVHVEQWYYKNTAMIFGDAAHGMTPYGGIGTALAFENISKFCDILKEKQNEYKIQKLLLHNQENYEQLQEVFKNYQESQKIHSFYAQEFCNFENYLYGVCNIAHPRFLIYTQTAMQLEALLPKMYVQPLNMAQFTDMNFVEIFDKVKIFVKFVEELIEGKESVEEVDFSNVEKELSDRILFVKGLKPELSFNC